MAFSGFGVNPVMTRNWLRLAARNAVSVPFVGHNIRHDRSRGGGISRIAVIHQVSFSALRADNITEKQFHVLAPVMHVHLIPKVVAKREEQPFLHSFRLNLHGK